MLVYTYAYAIGYSYYRRGELVIDGTIVDIAYVNRARTQKIRRVRWKVWWAKRRR